MNNTTGYYAVRFDGLSEIRLTHRRVDNALQALDEVLGTRYSVPNPMIADILHDFSSVQVKCIARTATEVRRDKVRREQLADQTGWTTPAYPPETIARARAALDRSMNDLEQRRAAVGGREEEK